MGVALFATVAYVVVSSRSRRDGILSPISVMAFSTLFYVVTVPVELTIRGESIVGFTGLQMTPPMSVQVVFLAVVAFASFSVGYALAVVNCRPVDMSCGDSGQVQQARWLTGGATVFGMLLLLTLFRENLAAAGDYLSNVRQTAGTSAAVGYFVINRWTYLAYGLFAFLSIAHSGRQVRSLALLAPLALWSFVTNDKDPLLVALLALSGLMFNRGRLRASKAAYVLPAGAVALLAFTAVAALSYGISRAGGVLSREMLAYTLARGVFTNIDPAGPSAVVATEVARPSGSGSWMTTIEGLVAWIPSTIRPLGYQEDLGVTFARAYFPNWQPGFGFGYSPIAEGWLAAGWLGVIVIFALLGTALGLARRLLAPRGRGHSTAVAPLRAASFSIVVGYLSFVSMRSSITTLVSTGAICVGLVIVLIASDRAASAVKEHSA
jgi:hypothetical protein